MQRIAAIVWALAISAAALAVSCGGGGGPRPVGPSGTIGPGGGIAFIGREAEGASRQVYLVDADSGAVRPVTDTQDFVAWPAWSRDRQRLAFIQWPGLGTSEEASPTPTAEASPTAEPTPIPEDPSLRHLVVVNADGSGQQTIGDSILLQTYSGGFSWSPDGSQIVYMAVVDPTEQTWRSELRMVNVADGSEVPLPEQRLGYLPAWSPDGTKIVFGAFVGEPDPDGNRETELFLMDSDGKNVQQITDRPGTDVAPSWSPDSTRIVWWAEKPATTEPAQPSVSLILMMDVASGQITELGEGSIPVWSPDGQHVAFVLEEQPPPGVVQSETNVDIYTVDVGTGERKQLTQGTSTNLWPTWSPDGQRIAFVSDRDSATGDIYVMNADGTDVRRLTDNDVAEAMLAWAPS
jgi:Tol biopolymer transport system component